MSVARPKPWEKSAAGDSAASAASSTPAGWSSVAAPAASAPATSAAAPSAAAASASASDTGSTPSVPPRPTSLAGNVAANPLATSGYGNSGYGMNSLGGGYGSYSGLGSGYGSYGSGYGGYGSGYGGYNSYGSGYGMGGYGMGGYGVGGYGRMGLGGYGANGGNGLENSTAATFQLIESIVGAVGGFAQMLESTYMATHSSFHAMMSVAEQFGHLKQSLGSVLGIFALLRWWKALLGKITGQSSTQLVAGEINASSFAKYQARAGQAARPRPSFKPLLIFLTAVFGFPYLFGRLIKAMANNQGTLPHDGPIDPSQLDFCQAVYDFVPENPQVELELKKGDLIAVLSRTDPSGAQSDWWRVRSRDGRSGYVPSTYVALLPKAKPIEEKTH